MKQQIARIVACLALVGGIAWAASYTVTLSLPPGTAGVDAVLVPGDDGGIKFEIDDWWCEEIDFCIGFGGGNVTVNGAVVAQADENGTYNVHIDVTEAAGGYRADVTVTDAVTQELVCFVSGVDIGEDAPTQAIARGVDIQSFSAQ